MTASSSLWLGGQPLVLASGSATRRAMLEAAGVPVRIVVPEVNERALESIFIDAAPAVVATLLARAKASDVSRQENRSLVLGADQTLACNGKRHHKPESREEAVEQLLSLSGQEHVLCSAFSIVRRGDVVQEKVSEAKLRMRSFDAAFARRYVEAAGDAVLSSVGGYQLEGLGVHLFEAIQGDHFTILGLPLMQLMHTLRELGLVSR